MTDTTSLVHVLWDISHKGLTIKDDFDQVASLIMQSQWYRATKAHERQEERWELYNEYPDLDGHHVSKIYRVETWIPDTQAWRVEAYTADPASATGCGLALILTGHKKINITVIDLDDVLERDAICSYLTAYMP